MTDLTDEQLRDLVRRTPTHVAATSPFDPAQVVAAYAVEKDRARRPSPPATPMHAPPTDEECRAAQLAWDQAKGLGEVEWMRAALTAFLAGRVAPAVTVTAADREALGKRAFTAWLVTFNTDRRLSWESLSDGQRSDWCDNAIADFQRGAEAALAAVLSLDGIGVRGAVAQARASLRLPAPETVVHADTAGARCPVEIGLRSADMSHVTCPACLRALLAEARRERDEARQDCAEVNADRARMAVEAEARRAVIPEPVRAFCEAALAADLNEDDEDAFYDTRKLAPAARAALSASAEPAPFTSGDVEEALARVIAEECDGTMVSQADWLHRRIGRRALAFMAGTVTSGPWPVSTETLDGWHLGKIEDAECSDMVRMLADMARRITALEKAQRGGR